MINIYDCIHKNKEGIILNDWFCKKCNKKQMAFQKLEIYKTPLYLIIYINKYFEIKDENSNKIYILKNQQEIIYKQSLNIKDFVINPDNEYNIYDLYGVVLNKGTNSLFKDTSFQNIAYCKNQGSWISYNGEKTELIDDPYDKDSFLFFYKARKINN